MLITVKYNYFQQNVSNENWAQTRHVLIFYSCILVCNVKFSLKSNDIQDIYFGFNELIENQFYTLHVLANTIIFTLKPIYQSLLVE